MAPILAGRAPQPDTGEGLKPAGWGNRPSSARLEASFMQDAGYELWRTPLLRLSENSLGTPNLAFMSRGNGAQCPFLGPRVDKKYDRGVTLTIFQTVSLGTWMNT